MSTPILLLLLGIAAGTMAYTVTRSSLFLSFREAVRNISGKFGEFLGKLVFCPYCFSHWTGVLLTLLFRPELSGHWFGFDYFASWFVITGSAALMTGLIALSTIAVRAAATPPASAKPPTANHG